MIILFRHSKIFCVFGQGSPYVNSIIYQKKNLPEGQNALLTWFNRSCYKIDIPYHMKEEGMFKLLGASVLLFVLTVLQSKAFALSDMNCRIKNGSISGIH